MGKNILLLLFSLGFTASGFAQDGPPNPQPGKCYAKCFTPDQYETVTEQIVIKPAKVQNTSVPPTYETKTVYVKIKSEASRFIPVPAQFETVSEKADLKSAGYVLVKPESKRITEAPAIYETVTEYHVTEAATTRIEVRQPELEAVTERVEIKAASTVWVQKKPDANCLNANPGDCFVWCMVEVPAVYQTVTKQVNKGCNGLGIADAGCSNTVNVPAEYKSMTVRKLKTPATIREELVPAEYVRAENLLSTGKLTKQVLKSPATVREEMIPAEYAAITSRVIKTSAGSRTETIPAEYATVTKRKLVKAGGFTEWREVLCGEKVTGYTVSQIQKALNDRGYNVGTPDNIMGTRTKAVLAKFQKDKGLPVGDLNIETLKALGINL